MLDAADPSSLAFLFHLNSEPWVRPDGPAEVHPPDAPSAAELRGGEETLALPPPETGSGGLFETISRRSSCRDFADAPLALDDLSSLLAGAYGLTRAERLESGLELSLRGVPSAGALYPLELYLVLRRVGELEEGVYHYEPSEHAIERLRTGIDRARLAEGFIAPAALDRANAVVFIAAVFERTLHKYGARGYRYILFEAAHVAQNLCLLASDRGLGSLCVGGFRDSVVNRFLELDPRTEGAVYSVGIGHPAGRG
jgi:SagB-type dehydrogenase family enzyme